MDCVLGRLGVKRPLAGRATAEATGERATELAGTARTGGEPVEKFAGARVDWRGRADEPVRN